MMKKMEVGKKLLALSLGWFSMALSAQNPIVFTGTPYIYMLGVTKRMLPGMPT